MSQGPPRRGDIWHIDLGKPVGHEAGDKRYGLVVSADRQAQFGLIVVLPITKTRTGYASNLELEKGRSGMRVTSYIQVERVRTVSIERFDSLTGVLDPVLLVEVERILKLVLDLR